MHIESLTLRNFRSYRELMIKPHPGMNILFGRNGAGKTNLLEAIHYCALGRSHRPVTDRDVIRRGEMSGGCGLTLQRRDGRREVAVRLSDDGKAFKQVFLDRKKAGSLADMMGCLQCVLFSPEDLQLVKEGPAVRRRFLDMLITQMSTEYFRALQGYMRAMDQRSNHLKAVRQGERLDEAMTDTFEEAMARFGAVISRYRIRITEKLSRIAGEKYGAISGITDEPFEVIYRPETAAADEASLLAAIRRSRSEDIRRGGCGAGPHREDLILTLKGVPMKTFASQGQIRTAALALRLAQLTLFTEDRGESPVLLLDDVMSELDMVRRTRLVQEIKGIQTFVTCTDETDLEGWAGCRCYRVDGSAEASLLVVTASGEAVPEQVLADPVFD